MLKVPTSKHASEWSNVKREIDIEPIFFTIHIFLLPQFTRGTRKYQVRHDTCSHTTHYQTTMKHASSIPQRNLIAAVILLR